MNKMISPSNKIELDEYLFQDLSKTGNIDNQQKISYNYVKLKIIKQINPTKLYISEYNQEENIDNEKNLNIIDEDNFINQENQQSSRKISQKINKFNKYFESNDEVILNNEEINEEIGINLNEEDNDHLDQEIEKIKELKNKKRKIQNFDEIYDQDQMEIRNKKTNQLIDYVYKMMEKRKAINYHSSDESDKEIFHWEMEKLKNGISSKNNKAYFNQNGRKEFESKKDEIFEDNTIGLKKYFRIIDEKINFENILLKVKKEYIREQKTIENEFSKIDSLQFKIEKTKENKMNLFNKIDFYINQYKRFKNWYFEIVKIQKRKHKMKYSKIIDFLNTEKVEFSE